MRDSGANVSRGPRQAARVPTPLRVFILVMSLVFAVEAAIMLGLARWMPTGADSLLVSLVDASLLAGVLAPAVWIVVVRPLQSLFEQRGDLLLRVFDAQERERVKIARDLHDELGQQLTALLLSLRAVDATEPSTGTSQRIADARRIAVESLESVRRLARGLSPVVLHDLGLRAAVERLCEDVAMASGLAIDREFDLPDTRIPPSVEIAAYRVFQEALTNIVRHSQATRATVRLAREGAALTISIVDNGCGIAPGEGAPPSHGIGLHGMRERVELLHGSLRVEPSPTAGTMVRAWIPKVFSHDEPHAHPDR